MEKKRILIVEDEEYIAQTLLDFLELISSHFEVEAVRTVAEARERLKDHWDVCICDCILPDGTACDIIKDHHDVPIIVTTGYVEEDKMSEVKAKNPNLVAVLRKPYPLEKLQEFLEKI